jgi:hypothetical protein
MTQFDRGVDNFLNERSDGSKVISHSPFLRIWTHHAIHRINNDECGVVGTTTRRCDDVCLFGNGEITITVGGTAQRR